MVLAPATESVGRGKVSEWQKEHPWEPSPRSFPQPVPIVCQSDLANPMLRARDLAVKGGTVCDRKLPLVEAVELLAKCEAGLLPVVGRGKPVGVLSERDVVRALSGGLSGFARSPVEKVMSKEWSQIRDDVTLDKLFDCFGNRGTLVVDRRGALVGVIYWRSLATHPNEGWAKCWRKCSNVRREARANQGEERHDGRIGLSLGNPPHALV